MTFDLDYCSGKIAHTQGWQSCCASGSNEAGFENGLESFPIPLQTRHNSSSSLAMM